MDKTFKIALVLVAFALCGCALLYVHAVTLSTTCIDPNPVILFFYSDSCPHCHNVMPFMKGIQENYTNVDVRYLEVSKNATNSEMFVVVNKQKGIVNYGVPEIIIRDKVLIGDIEIPKKLEALIPECARKL